MTGLEHIISEVQVTHQKNGQQIQTRGHRRSPSQPMSGKHQQSPLCLSLQHSV
ncbi:MAG: hypothetical protein Q8P67_09360 [archaeon]|nr:hypothetical protein [archaeon]